MLPVSEFGIKERRERDMLNLDITKRDDFVTNQEIFHRAESERVQKLKKLDVQQVLFDRGPEDTLCFSRIHPIAISATWDVSAEMNVLAQLYIPHRSTKILYLVASKETLLRRRSADVTKSRSNFENFIRLYYDLELSFYRKLDNVEFVDTDKLTTKDVLRIAGQYFGL